MRAEWFEDYPLGAVPPYYSDKARELFNAILDAERQYALEAIRAVGVDRVCESCFQFKCRCTSCAKCFGAGYYLQGLFANGELVLRKCNCKEDTWR